MITLILLREKAEIKFAKSGVTHVFVSANDPHDTDNLYKIRPEVNVSARGRKCLVFRSSVA